MSNVIAFKASRSLPDSVAQGQWGRVNMELSALGDLMSDIPQATVRGEETRAELAKAAQLLQEASMVLRSTHAREVPRYRSDESVT